MSVENAAQRALRILVVEDDLVGRKTLVRILTLLGHQVQAAGDLDEARRLIGEGHHVALLDLMLPDGDGSELIPFIQKRYPSMRVAVTTALHNPLRLAEVRALEPDAIFVKPLDLNALAHWLTAAG